MVERPVRAKGDGRQSRKVEMDVNQLIQELDEEAKSADGAALVIAFEERTSFVYADDADREKQLTSDLEAGGLPVAIMRWDLPVNGQFILRQRILADYLGHQWVKNYLVLVGETLRKVLLSSQIGTA
jgi:hypothetical protein